MSCWRLKNNISTLLLTIFIGVFVPISQANAQSVTENRVDKIVAPLMQKYHIDGVAVAFIHHAKKSIYLFGNTTKGIPITDTTPLQLGSITKVMTTLLFAEKIQEQQMNFTDSLTHYLTQLAANPFLNRISLEQLATFASGLPFNQPDSINTKQQLQQYLLHWQPAAPTQFQWQYSNIGLGLLGDVLAAENHQSLNTLFKDDIFIPLDMPTSSLSSTPETPPFSEKFLPGTWALKSTIVDMSNFLSAAIGLPNTPETILAAMQLAQTPRIAVGNMKQALAWQVFSLQNPSLLLNTAQYLNIYGSFPIHILPNNLQHYNPNTLMDKSGITHQFQSYMAVIPSRQSGVVIIVNNRQVPLDAVIKAGREILLS